MKNTKTSFARADDMWWSRRSRLSVCVWHLEKQMYIYLWMPHSGSQRACALKLNRLQTNKAHSWLWSRLNIAFKPTE